MSRERRHDWWPPLATAGAPLAFLAVALLSLVRQGTVAVHQCVAGGSPAGWLGIRLSLLRTDVDCPSGSVALGADGRHVIGVVAIVALPVLFAHLAGLGLGFGLVALLRRAFTAVRSLASRVASRLPVVVPVVRDTGQPPVVAACTGAVQRIVVSALRGRAPPVARVA